MLNMLRSYTAAQGPNCRMSNSTEWGGGSAHRSNLMLICYLLVMSCYLLQFLPNDPHLFPVAALLTDGGSLQVSFSHLTNARFGMLQLGKKADPQRVRVNPYCPLLAKQNPFVSKSTKVVRDCRLPVTNTIICGHYIPRRQVYIFNVIC